MIEKIFIDTDVILDVALKRDVFGKYGAIIFDSIEKKLFNGYTSSTIITNIYYVQRKLESHNKAINFIRKLLLLLKILPVDSEIIHKAVESNFKDFEDSIQNETALKYNVDYLITRNLNDYKKTQLEVLSPEEFIKIKISNIAGY